MAKVAGAVAERVFFGTSSANSICKIRREDGGTFIVGPEHTLDRIASIGKVNWRDKSYVCFSIKIKINSEYGENQLVRCGG